MEKHDESIKDVVGIGNAIVDILASGDEDFLGHHGLTKGAMTLVDAKQVTAIQRDMESTTEMSGGSVGNTMAGLASLGGTGSYIGKIHTDAPGDTFRQDMEKLGIYFGTPISTTGSMTARCLVIVTPDGQRSMATYLGACLELGPEDIDEAMIVGHRIVYLEGYLWDSPKATAIISKAIRIAGANDRKVALTLSDSYCVDRHRESFQELINKKVDILLANEEEITSLYQVDNVDEAIDLARANCDLLAVTCGAGGSIVASCDHVSRIQAIPVKKVLDTTGAGDLYAAGFLFGITHGYDPRACGHLGAIVAAEIITHVGARPATDLKTLISQTR